MESTIILKQKYPGSLEYEQKSETCKCVCAIRTLANCQMDNYRLPRVCIFFRFTLQFTELHIYSNAGLCYMRTSLNTVPISTARCCMSTRPLAINWATYMTNIRRVAFPGCSHSPIFAIGTAAVAHVPMSN